MVPDELGAAETAINFTDQFVDAGVAKLDAMFGKGHAAANPQMLAAYMAACTSNLNAFMTAAAATMQDVALDEALADFEADLLAAPAPAPKPKPKPQGRRR